FASDLHEAIAALSKRWPAFDNFVACAKTGVIATPARSVVATMLTNDGLKRNPTGNMTSPFIANCAAIMRFLKSKTRARSISRLHDPCPLWVKKGHEQCTRQCPQRAKSGLMQRTKSLLNNFVCTRE